MTKGDGLWLIKSYDFFSQVIKWGYMTYMGTNILSL